jgi:hypothetical protein
VPPNRTISVPGGSQALERTEVVQVRLGARAGAVRRPDLLGATLVKARAVDVDDAPESQRRDVAFLLSLCADPAPLDAAIRSSERGWLRRRRELLDRDHPAWRGVQDAQSGRDTLAILARL